MRKDSVLKMTECEVRHRGTKQRWILAVFRRKQLELPPGKIDDGVSKDCQRPFGQQPRRLIRRAAGE